MSPQDQNQTENNSRIGPLHESKLMIRESHLDSFGHVNNATYLQIFEDARWDIIAPNGFGLKEVHERGQGPVILDIHLQFRKELRNRETVTIQTWCTKHSGKTSILRQVIINEKGEEACIADFVFGLFDLRARKLIDPTPEWEKALGLR